MLQLRPNCECCDVDLTPESGDARICSFEWLNEVESQRSCVPPGTRSLEVGLHRQGSRPAVCDRPTLNEQCERSSS